MAKTKKIKLNRIRKIRLKGVSPFFDKVRVRKVKPKPELVKKKKKKKKSDYA